MATTVDPRYFNIARAGYHTSALMMQRKRRHAISTGFVQSHIARGNRNLLVIGLSLTAIGGGLALLFGHWFPALLCLPGIVALGAWLRRVASPASHPIYKQLARYGEPNELVARIDQEFAGVRANDVAQLGVTWFAQGNIYGLDLVPWQEIAWLYLYSRRYNHVRSNYIRVWSRNGTQLVALTWTEMERAEQFLSALHARAPWAEVGYSAELEKQWHKQRAEFLRRVDMRKALLATERITT
jgi:hypothetical protein